METEKGKEEDCFQVWNCSPALPLLCFPLQTSKVFCRRLFPGLEKNCWVPKKTLTGFVLMPVPIFLVGATLQNSREKKGQKDFRSLEKKEKITKCHAAKKKKTNLSGRCWKNGIKERKRLNAEIFFSHMQYVPSPEILFECYRGKWMRQRYMKEREKTTNVHGSRNGTDFFGGKVCVCVWPLAPPPLLISESKDTAAESLISSLFFMGKGTPFPFPSKNLPSLAIIADSLAAARSQIKKGGGGVKPADWLRTWRWWPNLGGGGRRNRKKKRITLDNSYFFQRLFSSSSSSDDCGGGYLWSRGRRRFCDFPLS